MPVCCEYCVLSGSLCDRPITRPEESYGLWCVGVCDLDTSWMRRPWPTGGCRATNKQISLSLSPLLMKPSDSMSCPQQPDTLDPITIQLYTHHTLKSNSLAGIIIPVKTNTSHFCLFQTQSIQPPIRWWLETFFPEDKADRTGEAGHSPPSGAEIKNACDYTSTPRHAFMTRCLIRHWKKFTSLGVFVSLFTSVHLFAWNGATPTGQIFTLHIWNFYWNLSTNPNFSYNQGKIRNFTLIPMCIYINSPLVAFIIETPCALWTAQRAVCDLNTIFCKSLCLRYCDIYDISKPTKHKSLAKTRSMCFVKHGRVHFKCSHCRCCYYNYSQL
jgi:hypothetical protein